VDNLTDIAVFVRVVDAGSFTKAADQLRLSRAVISKYITRLEARLGARVLNRTTRSLSLTEAGATLYERSRGALGQIEEAEAEVSQLQTEPRGMLKIAAPMSFGILHIAPALPAFLSQFTAVSVEMMLDDRMVDVIEEGFDVAIRITANLADSTLVARRLAPCHFAVCASTDYLKRQGIPLTPDDLRAHNCIVYTYSTKPNVWRFLTPDAQDLAVPVGGNLRSNNGLAGREAALSGLGIVMSPSFFVGDLIREGRLQALLTGYGTPEISVYAIYPERKYVPPKVSAFIDFFAQRFGPEPYWDQYRKTKSNAKE
jgi:DNA-binding transcriptional LysR family regulator